MLTQIPTSTLRKLVKLSERKEALMAEIQRIDHDIRRLGREFEQMPGGGVHKGQVTFSAAPKKKARRRSRLGSSSRQR